MPKRTVKADSQYLREADIPDRHDTVDTVALALVVPAIIAKLGTSTVKLHEAKPNWSLYRVELRRGNPFIAREMCDRCGKVWVPPAWRKIRKCTVDNIGDVYVETGICKDCINASVYVDSFLDGDPLTEKEAKELFYKYAVDYERNWRIVLAAAPEELLSEAEWERACKFFNGCAVCGGPIEVRGRYFPTYLNGKYTAWNIIPMCKSCMDKHYKGRINKTREVKRYKVFSTHEYFNKSKTARVYLLQQMREHKIYMEPLLPFMRRFRETKVLKGSTSDD